MKVNELTHSVIGAAMEVHRELGPGKPERAYERALCLELGSQGISHQSQKPLPVVYKGMRLDCGYRLDLLVADTLVVEIKAVDALAPIHTAQVLTYLKLGGWRWALLLNFQVALLKEGIRRLVMDPPKETTEARRSESQRENEVTPEGDLRGDRKDNEISCAVLAAAREVHQHLGPGLLASAFEACLCHELALRHIPFVRRTALPLSYKGSPLGESAEVALVVADRVLVCPKAVEALHTVDEADLLSLLRLGGWPQGLLLNFNTRLLRDGLRRLLNQSL